MTTHYPNTKAKRREGMAAFRAQMLRAHERALSRSTGKDAEIQRYFVEAIKASQEKHRDA